MSLTAYTPLTWVDYADSPDLSAANLNHLETGVQAVTTELITFEGVVAASYQPLSSELTALSGLSAAGYVKRTGSAAYSVVASIPQSDVSGLVAALATIPGASSTTPAALGASGAVGTGTTWARADHVHIYPTAAQVGAEAALGNPGTSGYVLSSTTGGVRSWVASVASLAWSAITSKPTTLAGYGITDAQAALGYTPVNKAGDTGVGMLQVNYTSTTSSTRGVLIGSIGNYLSSSSASLAIGIPTAASNWPLEIQKNGVTIFSVDTTGTMGFGIVPVARISGLTGWATKTYTNGSTTDVAEGTNLYFTSARAIAALGYTPVNKAGDTGVGMLQVNYTSTTSSTRGVLIGALGNYLSSSAASLAIGIPTAATNWPLEIQKNGVTIFSVDTTGTLNNGIVPVARITGLATVATSGSASDLGSGILGTGRMPGLTGDVTSAAGGVYTTLANIQGVPVTTLTANGFLQYAGGNLVWTTSVAHGFINDWGTATSGFVTGGPYQPLSSDLTALAASVAISSSAGAANFFSDVASGDAVMRWGSPYTETVRLGVMSNSSGNNASSLWFSASSAGTNYSFTATGTVRSSNGNYGNAAPLLQVGDNQYGLSSSGGSLYLHQPNGSSFLARRGGNTYSIWDSGNLNPGNYLPLVGGTLTGGLTGTTATMSGVICSGYSSGSNANLVGNWNSGGYYGIGGTGILNDYTILLQGVSNLGVANGNSANLKVTGTITSVAAANAVGLQINAAYGSGQIRSWNFSNIAAQVLGIGPSTDPSLIMLTGTMGSGSNAIYLQGFVNANSLVAGNLSLNGPLAIASAGTGCLAVPYGSTTNAPTPVEGQILLVQGGPGSGPVSTYLAVPSGVTWTIKYRTSTGATAWVGAGGTIDFGHLSGFLIGGADGNWHLIHV